MTDSTQKKRVADWIVSKLSDAGVNHVFLLPGGGAMHLNDALACEPRITAVPCHHEQACGIAAEAYGRTDHENNPGFGVAMVTTGPGATNIITAVAGAWIDSIPLLIISGQAKRTDRLNGRPIRQGGVQEVDIVPIVQSITKYAVTVTDPEKIVDHFDAALNAMTSGRPGPVWIDVPLDVQAALIETKDRPSVGSANSELFDDIDLSDVFQMITEAKRPLILAGHGVRISGASKRFRELVKQLQVPSVLTWNALDLLPYEDPLNIGRPGVVATRAANFAVQNCDLLISIGARLDNIVTAYNPAGFARGAKKIVVDVDSAELDNKSSMGIEKPLEMNAAVFIESLLKISRATNNPEWNAKCLDWKLRYPQNEGSHFPESGPIGHAHFVDSLSVSIPSDTLIATGSSGLAIEFYYAGFRNKEGQRTFLTSGLGSMGYGLPAAIGACLGNSSAPMIAVESDGSLQLNLQELATLTSQNLPICLFVMNNDGYASIRNTQRNYFDGRYLSSGPESGLLLPDLEKVAETYNLPYLRIVHCENLVDQLTRAQQLPRPCIIDVRLISDESLQPKCAAITREDGSIVSMPLEDMSPLLNLETLRQEMCLPLTEESMNARK